MSIWQIIARLVPFVRPYRGLVIASLLLTLLGAFAAQVNPLVLLYTVDTVERLLKEGVAASESTSLLLFISAILFAKELINIETVAFVGLSGAGKSTLLNLLCKFYEPTDGEIFLDGKKLEEYDTHLLRRNIGLVLQKNHIFRGSIEENIRYGYMRASTEEVIAAAKQAYLHDQIEKLPHCYLNEAQSLSGGQQQRIAIARLFLKDPPIIFLDEPTASLDAIATEQIKNSLDAIKEDRTTVVISHSISQIIDSDVIYVLKEGRVVEIGTHDELYEKEGTYFEIFNASARSLNLDKIADTLDGGKL